MARIQNRLLEPHYRGTLVERLPETTILGNKKTIVTTRIAVVYSFTPHVCECVHPGQTLSTSKLAGMRVVMTTECDRVAYGTRIIDEYRLTDENRRCRRQEHKVSIQYTPWRIYLSKSLCRKNNGRTRNNRITMCWALPATGALWHSVIIVLLRRSVDYVENS